MAILVTGALIGLLAGTAPPPFAAPPTDAAGDPVTDTAAPEATRVFVFPAGDLYPLNVASPHRLTNAVEVARVSSVGIADSGESRMILRLGGRFGILRSSSRSGEDRVWQLGIEAGFSGQFDNDFSQDSIGWDGFYGLTLARRQNRALAWKLGLLHTSAHVGDEYAERTTRRRLGYTREEALAGVSLRLNDRLRGYVEAAYGYERRLDVQQPWRAQAGLVLEDGERWWQGRFGWYAAVDLSGWEERDWRLDAAAQAGLLFPGAERAWRVGVQWVDGRPGMAEFFQDIERSISAGLWLDL